MNVSSVKNLNGGSFSAVQDAALTDFVSSNSASWTGGGGTTYTSPSGTILISGNTLEATNSAISTTVREGFVSSFGNKNIGPSEYGKVNFSWNESLPSTEFHFVAYSNDQEHTITYSANTNLTGEIITSSWFTPVSITVPNATSLDIWCTDWMVIEQCVASAAGSIETTVGELAWVSALSSLQPRGDYYSASNPSGFITGVPDSYLQNTDLTITDNKVTEISGIPLAAGGEVPQGVMVESGLEYNANNKISGYNGSAFAGEEQVQSDWTESAVDSPAYILNKPTEKNLIPGTNVTITETDDDVTIETTEIASGLQLVAGHGVTLTVSGSNIVAAADETMLWSGSGNGNTTYNLSDSMTNFERIKILYNPWVDSTISHYFEFDYNNVPSLDQSIFTDLNLYTSGVMRLMTVGFSAISDSSLGVNGIVYFDGTFNGQTLDKSNVRVYKIIGINRIAGA